MSGKHVVIEWNEKHGYWWASWGGETFYDAERYMRTWETPEAAGAWVRENHPDIIWITFPPPKE